MSAGKAEDKASDWRRGIGYAALLKAISLQRLWQRCGQILTCTRHGFVSCGFNVPSKKSDALSVFPAYDSAHYLLIAEEAT